MLLLDYFQSQPVCPEPAAIRRRAQAGDPAQAQRAMGDIVEEATRAVLGLDG